MFRNDETGASSDTPIALLVGAKMLVLGLVTALGYTLAVVLYKRPMYSWAYEVVDWAVILVMFTPFDLYHKLYLNVPAVICMLLANFVITHQVRLWFSRRYVFMFMRGKSSKGT